MELKNYEIPKTLLPDAKETDYYFIPEIHRFIIRKSPNVSVYQAYKYLTEVLGKVIDTDEKIDVIIEQSSDVFEKILNAKQIKNLDISISYTNSDIMTESQKMIDDMLKDSKIGKIKIHTTPDHNDNLNKDGKFINGFLKLAQNNGTAEASIINNDNKKEKVITKNHPKKIKLKINIDLIVETVYNKIIKLYNKTEE